MWRFMKFLFVLISLFFLKNHACSSALDYQDIARYTKSLQINFSGKHVDFSDIHSDMACIEALHHNFLPNSEKDSKNLCLIRFTPVYQIINGSDINYEKGQALKEIKVVHSTQREAVFFSSFDPSSDLKGKTPTDDGNFYYCNSKVEDDHGNCFCNMYRWAGSLHLLKAELEKKSSTQLNALWCHELKMSDKINSLNAAVSSLNQSIVAHPGATQSPLNGFSLARYLTRITETLHVGCKEMSTDILNLACSEQNAFSYLKGTSLVPLKIKYLEQFSDTVGINKNKLLKTIVIHLHTTKHPCHMCGFSACIEFLETTPEYLALKNTLIQTGKISTDFRIVVLCSYRYAYSLRDGGELPNKPAIVSADQFAFDDADNLYRIGLCKLRQRFVADI